MELQSDPNQFTRDAWEANAEVWDERMGNEGNDFFNIQNVLNGFRYRCRDGEPPNQKKA